MSKLILSKDIKEKDLEIYMEKLNYKGITSDLYGIVGNWLISNEGDLLYFCTNKDDVNAFYPIYSNMHNEQNWRDYLKSKIWFSSNVQNDFEAAFRIAKQLKNDY